MRKKWWLHPWLHPSMWKIPVEDRRSAWVCVGLFTILVVSVGIGRWWLQLSSAPKDKPPSPAQIAVELRDDRIVIKRDGAATDEKPSSALVRELKRLEK